MATVRHPPFKQGKEDVGFRDAVILLSVVDDLVAAKDDIGALVARDDAFHDPMVIEFAARAGAELQVFRSVEAVFDSLKRDAAKYEREQWEAATAAVQRSLGSRLPEIEKFINQTLDVPEFGLVAGARVVAAPRVEALAVRGVRAAPLESRAVERVRFSFDVEAKIHVTVEKFDLPQPRRVKVGSETTGLGEVRSIVLPMTPWPPGSVVRDSPMTSLIFARPTDDLEVRGVVRVQASSDPKFQAFAFESAALALEGVGGMSVGL